MKKTGILVTGLIIILILLTTFLLALTAPDFSSSDYPHVFSHTKAICSPANFCQDYEIFCENNKMSKMSPITGAAVQFSPAWKDLRDKESIKNIC